MSRVPQMTLGALLIACLAIGAFVATNSGEGEVPVVHGVTKEVEQDTAGNPSVLWNALIVDLSEKTGETITKILNQPARQAGEHLGVVQAGVADAQLRRFHAAYLARQIPLDCWEKSTALRFVLPSSLSRACESESERDALWLATFETFRESVANIHAEGALACAIFSSQALTAVEASEPAHEMLIDYGLQALRDASEDESVSLRELRCIGKVLVDSAGVTRSRDLELMLVSGVLAQTRHPSAATDYLTSLVLGDRLSRWGEPIAAAFALKQPPVSWGLVEVLRYFVVGDGSDSAQTADALNLVPPTLFRSPHDASRRAALELVAEFSGRVRAEDLLAEVLADTDYGGEVVFFMADNRRIPTSVFAELLRADDPRHAAWAIAGLGKRAAWSTDARELVLDIISSGSPSRSSEALRAISINSERFAIEILESTLTGQAPEGIRSLCAQLLKPNDTSSARTLTMAAGDDTNPERVRLEAFIALLAVDAVAMCQRELAFMAADSSSLVRDHSRAFQWVLDYASKPTEDWSDWEDLDSSVRMRCLESFGVVAESEEQIGPNSVTSAIEKLISAGPKPRRLLAGISDVVQWRIWVMHNLLIENRNHR